MGLNIYISFEIFLIDLNVNEENYICALRSTLWKPTLFSKHKVNDIQIMVFNIHARPMWEVNTDVHYILDPYST
jgi:hypothetical protein